jgi:hypothetical protein
MMLQEAFISNRYAAFGGFLFILLARVSFSWHGQIDSWHIKSI